MGKNLKGRELGTGLSQRKDGKYSARYLSKSGKRIEKYFPKLQDARTWLAETKYQERHNDIGMAANMTVDAWFQYWLYNIKKNTIRMSTWENYKGRYEYDIKELIGDMIISDVKPFHCQNILNEMFEKGYAKGTINQTKIALHAFFSSAVANEIIPKNPISREIKCPGSKKAERRVLTVDEQKAFIESCSDSPYREEYCFILQTGLRVGELLALTWADVDFQKKVLKISKSLHYQGKKERQFVLTETKTKKGMREIPLTDEAVEILRRKRNKRKKRKVASIEYADNIFLNKKGRPEYPVYYNKEIKRIASEIGIEEFSIHTLRHTFATRCIEAGMRPKTLQEILGHANIAVTMDLYVHVTDDERASEMKKLENMYKMA